MKSSLLFFLLLFRSLWVVSQYSSTIHYTVKEGLPSSTVYSIVQDNKGFIWIGTDAGLVRYDGSRFRVYTISDGLPDNEVLGLHYDQKMDRIWIVTYCKQACYYQNGVFYTSPIDTSLGKIKCDYGEFINGNIQKGRGEFLYNAGSIYDCSKGKVEKIVIKEPRIFNVHKWNDSIIDVLTEIGVIGYNNGHMRHEYPNYHSSNIGTGGNNGKWIDSLLIRFNYYKIEVYNKTVTGDYVLQKEMLLDNKIIPSDIIQSKSKYIISVWNDGLYSIDTGFNSPLVKIWKGSVNDCYEDYDGNLWIATVDDGIYLLEKQNVVNYNSENGLRHDNATSLYFDKLTKRLFIGNTSGEVFVLEKNLLKQVDINYGKVFQKIREITGFKENLFLISENLIVNSDLTKHQTFNIPHWSGAPKSILKLKDGNTILIGLIASVMSFEIDRNLFTEKPCFKRVIALAQHP